MPGTSQRTTPAAKISCEHKTRKTRCRLCGGGSICCHNNVRDSCKKCIVQTTIAKHTGQHLPPTSRAKRSQSNDNIQAASCSTATMPLRPVPVVAMAVQIITPMVHKDFEKSHAHYNEFKIRAGQGTFWDFSGASYFGLVCFFSATSVFSKNQNVCTFNMNSTRIAHPIIWATSERFGNSVCAFLKSNIKMRIAERLQLWLRKQLWLRQQSFTISMNKKLSEWCNCKQCSCKKNNSCRGAAIAMVSEPKNHSLLPFHFRVVDASLLPWALRQTVDVAAIVVEELSPVNAAPQAPATTENTQHS